MSDIDIDAIRERYSDEWPYPEDRIDYIDHDAPTLLAEVDRLTAELKKGADINGKLLDLLKSEEFNRELLHRLGNAMSEAIERGGSDADRHDRQQAAKAAWDAELRR